MGALMISIEINTKNGNLIKLSTEEAEEIYLALKNLFDKSGKEYPLIPTYPISKFPVYPYPGWTTTVNLDETNVTQAMLDSARGL